eukprot:jgi/Hompol1/70/HPOL_003907-RA
MDVDGKEDDDPQISLKASIRRSVVRKLESIGREWTAEYVYAVGELVFEQAKTMGADLEAFAK